MRNAATAVGCLLLILLIGTRAVAAFAFDEDWPALPEVVLRATPEYPAVARQAGVEGTVILQAFVDSLGQVGEVRVQTWIPLLDQAALDCVRRWKFKPAISNGHPFGVWVPTP